MRISGGALGKVGRFVGTLSHPPGNVGAAWPMLTVQSPAHVNQSFSADQYDVDTCGWCVRIGADDVVGGWTDARLAPTA